MLSEHKITDNETLTFTTVDTDTQNTVVTRYNTMVGGQNLDRVISESCYKIEPSKIRSQFIKNASKLAYMLMLVCATTEAYYHIEIMHGPITRSLYSIKYDLPFVKYKYR